MNASNNTTMLEYVENYYHEKYPDSCLSRQWNQIECMAHVLNLGAQQIFKNFKQIVDKHECKVNSADPLVTAVSRLAFLCRKMRDSLKLRRGLKKVLCVKDICNAIFSLFSRA